MKPVIETIYDYGSGIAIVTFTWFRINLQIVPGFIGLLKIITLVGPKAREIVQQMIKKNQKKPKQM